VPVSQFCEFVGLNFALFSALRLLTRIWLFRSFLGLPFYESFYESRDEIEFLLEELLRPIIKFFFSFSIET